MKLVSYKLKDKPSAYRIGCRIDQKIIDLQESYRAFLVSTGKKDLIQQIDCIFPSDPNSFFLQGENAIDRARMGYHYIMNKSDRSKYMLDLGEVSYGVPVSTSSKIICVGKNYAEHVAEMNDGDIPEFPVLFAKFNNAIIGPENYIEKPTLTHKLDYEAELAIVIGKEASNVCKEEVYDYIAGYTIANDISARDLQKRTPQWLQGKSLDRSTPIGPWIVTSDDIVDPCNLSIRSFVNGEKRQDSNTRHFIFDIPNLIEFISHLITLDPGDIILTGTPDGVGVAMQPPQFLQDGDIISLEVEGIGKLENKIMERKANK
ncbi:fumarylacetoacetate hydrolase family protein [Virgibacillus alimentarius]|uniref:Acylpyruvate hydrolase n=1 Tax=Virgibacillus alimentarius TaxID=698769 RepID=A0ABS4S8W7_9BACI|nr:MULTISPECIES: fumarylacetoacetate hydrolase family protein [Virgibacillus]MBP2257942.1 acylpyruvate hydrolase [Virgibacillus alimentarius]HLR65965.1 fumarylacetoacetate hydrolase family protein [Virgibacillus sp.]